MSLLGIDIGSSRCKAVAFDVGGAIVAAAEAAYPTSAPGPGLLEVDAAALWKAFVEVVRGVTGRTGGDPVESLAISSHGETFFAVGRGGEALGAGIMNADNRATAEADWWQRQVGRETIYQLTGTVVHPMYPLAKIEWLRVHDTERWSAASRFASVADLVLERLSLPPYVDYSLASRYMAFDLSRKQWAEEILDIAGLSASRLPIPVPAGTRAGMLSRAAAAQLGLDTGVCVAVGGHDQPCCALGVGAMSSGQVGVSMGTYECLTKVCAEPATGTDAFAASLNSACHVVPDSHVCFAFFPSGAMLQWLVDTLGASDHSALEPCLPDQPSGVLVTPHLIGSCNPHWDARARGAIYGIDAATTVHDLYKGVLEGIAFEHALNAQVLADCTGPLGTVCVAGGGMRSRFGLRLRSALTGRAIRVSATQEATCLGAAVLAGLAVGVYESPDDATGATARIAEVIEPDERLAAAYLPHFERYRALYPALAPMRETEP